MISLTVSALTALAVGFIAWAADKRRARYGIFLLPGLSLAAGLLLWLLLQMTGFGSDPELFWLVWVLPPVAGAVCAAVTARQVGRRREAGDTAELEHALRL